MLGPKRTARELSRNRQIPGTVVVQDGPESGPAGCRQISSDFCYRLPMNCARCRILQQIAETLERAYVNAVGRADEIRTDPARAQHVQRVTENARTDYKASMKNLERHRQIHSTQAETVANSDRV